MFQSASGQQAAQAFPDSSIINFNRGQAGTARPEIFDSLNRLIKQRVSPPARFGINPSFRSYTRIWKTGEKPKREKSKRRRLF
jgi:hypothetical protein